MKTSYQIQFTSLLIIHIFRHADPRDVTVGYIAYARKRSTFVFLCLFHFRHYWRAIMGGYFAAALRLATA